ncbi:hypothetical protein QWY14_10395 [Planococcus sp. N028]|uniref:Uncharacterized protein n=1 Tax=Planococcus shixiaomingii TaxID=3058393 RepID=A0ABT8N2T7_9BACL|nr:hypothetical protein [Planococcus sp. N028]MDN7242211.1 hypothetical protein [Planococcus sp. N028]
MIADVILGNNIDTAMWIKELKKGSNTIIIVDYDNNHNFIKENEVMYMSPQIAKKYIEKFDTINYYKSLYGYPGMQGNMSSLYRRKT